MKKQFYLSLFTAIAIIFTSNRTSAQDYTITSYDVSIDISRDGYFEVHEEIDAFFTDRARGIIRDIPLRYNVNGQNIKVKIDDVSVDDWKYKVTTSNNDISIRIGDPDVYLDGNQTYKINYRVFGAYVFADDHTEFYYSFLGDQWNTDIHNASYQINFPDDILIYDQDMLVFAGRSGSQERNATISKTGNTVSGRATTTLGKGKDLTVAINLPKDYITVPANMVNEEGEIEYTGSDSKSSRGFKDYTFPIPLALMALLFGAYKRFGVNAGDDREIPEQYYPPDGMSPAEVGTFYDFTAHDRDLISLIPLWGNEGYIEMRSIPNHEGEHDLYFYKLKDLDKDVPEYERTFFEGLFADGDQVFLSDLKNKFYTTMSSSKSSLHKEVKEYRLYDKKAKGWFKSYKSILAMIASFVLGIVVMIVWQQFITGALLIALGIMLIVFMARRPKLTEEGKSLHDEMVGLYKFLKNPSSEKVNELMKNNDKYLDLIFPYVVAFGLDKSWNKEISKYDIADYHPSWYYYTHADGSHRRPASFTDFTESFNVKTINSVFSSAPHSSGGSSGGGFSGGSSGGGFGGGGGSSW